MIRALAAAALTLFLMTAAGPAGAVALFTTPTGTGSDCTQAAPCSLSEALDNQAADGDNLYLAGGTYTGPPGSVVARIASTVVIRGGWDGEETTPPVVDPETNVTILDGQENKRVVEITSTAAILIGLTIKDGFRTVFGAGIYGDGTALVLRDVTVDSCVVFNSTGSDTFGGGVYLRDSTLWARNSTFTMNSSYCTGGCTASDGGGVYLTSPENVVIIDSSFDRNDAWTGSGLRIINTNVDDPEVTIRGSGFQQNGTSASANPALSAYGAAIHLNNVEATISDSIFSENYAGDQGGAIYAVSTGLHLYRNSFWMNSSDNAPGVFLSTDTVIDSENNLFVNNEALTPTYPTSGIHLESNATGTMRHTTIIGPTTEPQGAGVRATSSASVTMENTILARLDTGILSGTGATVNFDGTLFGESTWNNDSDTGGAGSLIPGATILNQDPGFVDGAALNFRLAKDSLAKDAGIEAGINRDLEKTPRDASPDIGAFEYAQKLAVGSPEKGEVIPAGSTFNPLWGAPAKARTFTVKYSLDNGASWTLIQKNLPENTVDWKVPKVWKNQKNCRLKVVAYNDSGKKVGSAVSKRFTIAVLTVPVPEEGYQMTAGDTEIIYWETYTTRKRVNKAVLKYTRNGGKSWQKFEPGSDPFDPQIFFWGVPVPGATKDECRIKVILKSKSGKTLGKAVTEGWFSIMVP